MEDQFPLLLSGNFCKVISWHLCFVCSNFSNMKTKESSQIMTKKRFIHQVTSGMLSTDKVLTKLSEELYSFEKKYNMRSEVFYNLIVGTPAEDSPDFINWAICYRSYFRTLQSKFPVKGLTSALWESPGSSDYQPVLVSIHNPHKCFYTAGHISPWFPLFSWNCDYIFRPSDKFTCRERIYPAIERRIWVYYAQSGD